MDWTQQPPHYQHHRHHQPAEASWPSYARTQPPPQPAVAAAAAVPPLRPYSHHVASGSYQQTPGHGWRQLGMGNDPAGAGQQVNVACNPSAAGAAVNLSRFPPAPCVDHHQNARQHAPHPYRTGGAAPEDLTVRAGGTAAWQQQAGATGGVAGNATPKRVWISGGGGSAGAAAAVGQHHHPTSGNNKWAGTPEWREPTHSSYKQPHYGQQPHHQQHHRHQQQTKKQRKAGMRGKPSKQPCGKPSGPIPTASDACMRALGLVAVSGFIRVSNGLEGTCVELSNVAREGAAWQLKVNSARLLPPRLQRFWPRGKKQKRVLLRLPPSRLIQRKLVTSVVILNSESIGKDFMWPSGVEKVRFDIFKRDISKISWPSTVREITLSSSFSQPIEKVVWPKNLQVLKLGEEFNRPVEGVAFPDGMHRIEFNRDFDQPIAGVKWPSQLRVLEFGAHFSRPLEGVVWPDALQVLSFGVYFDQPIHVAPLPKDLQVLRLGEVFEQPLDDVVWPKGLKEVDIGWSFTGKHSPRLAEVVWPSGLRQMKAPKNVDMGRLPEGCCWLEADEPRDVYPDDDEIDPFSLGFDWRMWEHFMDSD